MIPEEVTKDWAVACSVCGNLDSEKGLRFCGKYIVCFACGWSVAGWVMVNRTTGEKLRIETCR